MNEILKRGIIQRIFSEHFSTYQQTHRLSVRERRAGNCITTCRTEAQGCHMNECEEGHFQELCNNSCRHRSCSLCGYMETQAWIESQEKKKLSCQHYHAIFTIPHELLLIWAYNRKHFTSLLFRASLETLKDFLLDPKYLGALPGMLGAFHSWGETLNLHPHLHFLITGGGLNEKGEWISAKNSFLLPAAAVRAKFQGKFISYLKEGFGFSNSKRGSQKQKRQLTPPKDFSRQECLSLLRKLEKKKWNVRIQPPYAHAQGVIKYLGSYMRRGPISEKRFQFYDGKNLAISYKRPGEHKEDKFRITGNDFIQRLLKHVPPKGLHVVRSYGLFHHRCQEKLLKAKAILKETSLKSKKKRKNSEEDLSPVSYSKLPQKKCPVCGKNLVTSIISYPSHSPPHKEAA